MLVPLYIKINNIIYNFTNVLGCGASGIVIEYTYKTKKYSLKIVQNEHNIDIHNAQYMSKIQNCQQYICKFFIFKNNNPVIQENYILMDYYKYTLKNITDIDYTNSISLLIKLIEACICFKNNGLYYTDIKPDNILFNKYDTHTEFVFADIGSFTIPEISVKGIATFPHPAHHKEGTVTDNFEHNIVWGLFVLFLFLLRGEQIYDIYSYRTSATTYDQHIQLLNTIKNEKIKIFLVTNMNTITTLDELLLGFQTLKTNLQTPTV